MAQPSERIGIAARKPASCFAKANAGQWKMDEEGKLAEDLYVDFRSVSMSVGQEI
jgi:hypothetical protein